MTLLRTFLSILFSLFFGTLLGLVIGYFEKQGTSLENTMDFLRSIPPIALFPLFILFFGLGDLSKISVSAFTGTLIVTLSGIYGIKQINKNHIKLAKKLGIKGKKLITGLLLPESLNTLFGGYRIAASFCLVFIIVTEMFLGGAEFGLGRKLIDAQMLFDTPQLYALIFTLGIIGYSLNKLFILLENKIIHWRGHY